MSLGTPVETNTTSLEPLIPLAEHPFDFELREWWVMA